MAATSDCSGLGEQRRDVYCFCASAPRIRHYTDVHSENQELLDVVFHPQGFLAEERIQMSGQVAGTDLC